EPRADLERDVTERGEVDRPREGGAPGDDQLGSVLARQVAYLIQIDALRVLAYTVRDDRVELAGVVHRADGGQMPAEGEVGLEHGIARLQEREVDRHVGLGARMGLHVDVLRSEELLGAGDGEI